MLHFRSRDPNELLVSIPHGQCFILQVSNAVDLSNLVQRIQDERAAIALNIFLDRPVSDDLRDLQLMVSNNVSLRKFTLVKVRNSKLQAMIVILKLIFQCTVMLIGLFFACTLTPLWL